MAGIVLLIVMFLRWYQLDSRSIDAWEAFSVTDIFLAAAAIAGILTAVLTAANTKPDAPITWEAGTVLVAFIATVLALYRLLDPPDDLTRCYGVYLGLITVLAVWSVPSWPSATSTRGGLSRAAQPARPRPASRRR